MTESQFTRKLLAELGKHPALKQAVIWKHADRFTAGVPDFSVSIGKHTLWIECKMSPKVPTKLQRYYLDRLRDGAIVVIARDNGRNATLWRGLEFEIYPFNELVEAIVRLVVNE